MCAPTGAGKTVVGEFAVFLALAAGQKCYYTTPIKALSNQKFNDLVDRHGARSVGLLTGDNSINADAPIVVMTTEVLRNMLYVGSDALTGLGYVVMDEVHYLGDRFRGAVWEEVLIHLPDSVRLVALSATVSNAEEFGDWLVTVRGDTRVIVHEQRPVPLWQHMLVGSRLFDLFPDSGSTSAPTSQPPAVNPELRHYLTERMRNFEIGPRGRDRRRGPGWRPPHRPDVVTRLDREGLLPLITFIFSRVGCDAAVRQCVQAGLWLTDPAERDEITALVEHRTVGIPAEDLEVLGYWEWLDGLRRGVAAHHAGLIPVFKETVEELFVRGLVRAVFATETLALGINMPARSVLLERLTKFNGETHADITPGEYTQLTGRAGRRGIDVEGHAVVLWGPDIDLARVAGLASTRTYPLRSSFRPSYNMAVNLVGQMGRSAARALLDASFAQFQADRGVAGLIAQIRRNENAVAEYATRMRLRSGRFLRVPGPAPGSLGARGRAVARGVSRASGHGRGIPGGPADRRRHSGASRPASGPRDRPRPGRESAGRPAPAGAHRAALGRPVVHGRLSGRCRGGRQRSGAASLQPPFAAGAARSGVRAPAGRRAAGAQPPPRRPGDAGRRGRAVARRGSRASRPRLSGSRRACSLGPAAEPARAGDGRPRPQGRGAHRLAGTHLRPDLRATGSAGLPGRRRSNAGGPPAGPHLVRVRPGRGRMPAGRRLGRARSGRAGRRGVDPRVRGPPRRAGRRADADGCRAGCGDRHGTGVGRHHRGRGGSRLAGDPRTGTGLRLAGLPLGPKRKSRPGAARDPGTRSVRSCRRATSSGGASRSSTSWIRSRWPRARRTRRSRSGPGWPRAPCAAGLWRKARSRNFRVWSPRRAQ